jgi:glucose/arabinose dehydrogenase
MDVRLTTLLGIGAMTLMACSSTATPAAPESAAAPTQLPTVTIGSEIAAGLVSPWGLAPLADGALVSERDTGRIVRVRPGAATSEVTQIAETVPAGEGGLLGLVIDPEGMWLFAYVTTQDDNRVIRMDLKDPAAAYDVILDGIPKADIHDGGRLVFGPDGYLYVATGDAAQPQSAQDPDSLGGKILRIDADGRIPDDNPFPGSPVWSLGHRNVQGMAFDSAGRLWSTEFGTSVADELNLIVAGGNYGWPAVEGTGGAPDYIDPMAQWSPTSLASPSGLAILDDVAYVASLRGEVLWQVALVDGRAATPVALDLGDLGRLRTIEAMDDGSLWLVTSNTDGRGDPRDGDDRILALTTTLASSPAQN